MPSFRNLVCLLATPLMVGLAPSARAESPVYEYPTTFDSTVSRTAAKADAIAARRAGLIADGEGRPDTAPAVTSPRLTRAEVQAQTLAARRLGLVVQGESPVREATASEQALLHEAAARARAARVAERG